MPVQWNPPSPAKALAGGEKVVEVPIKDLLRSAEQDIARAGRFSPEKLSRATQFLQSGQKVNVPEISVRGARTIIEDGLHRLKVALAMGETTAPVRVPVSQASKLLKVLGGAGKALGTEALSGGMMVPDLARGLGFWLQKAGLVTPPTPEEQEAAGQQLEQELSRYLPPPTPQAQLGGSVGEATLAESLGFYPSGGFLPSTFFGG